MTDERRTLVERLEERHGCVSLTLNRYVELRDAEIKLRKLEQIASAPVPEPECICATREYPYFSESCAEHGHLAGEPVPGIDIGGTILPDTRTPDEHTPQTRRDNTWPANTRRRNRDD